MPNNPSMIDPAWTDVAPGEVPQVTVPNQPINAIGQAPDAIDQPTNYELRPDESLPPEERQYDLSPNIDRSSSFDPKSEKLFLDPLTNRTFSAPIDISDRKAIEIYRSSFLGNELNYKDGAYEDLIKQAIDVGGSNLKNPGYISEVFLKTAGMAASYSIYRPPTELLQLWDSYAHNPALIGQFTGITAPMMAGGALAKASTEAAFSGLAYVGSKVPFIAKLINGAAAGEKALSLSTGINVATIDNIIGGSVIAGGSMVPYNFVSNVQNQIKNNEDRVKAGQPEKPIKYGDTFGLSVEQALPFMYLGAVGGAFAKSIAGMTGINATKQVLKETAIQSGGMYLISKAQGMSDEDAALSAQMIGFIHLGGVAYESLKPQQLIDSSKMTVAQYLMAKNSSLSPSVAYEISKNFHDQLAKEILTDNKAKSAPKGPSHTPEDIVRGAQLKLESLNSKDQATLTPQEQQEKLFLENYGSDHAAIAKAYGISVGNKNPVVDQVKPSIDNQFTNPNSVELLDYLSQYLKPQQVASLSGQQRLELANGPLEKLRDLAIEKNPMDSIVSSRESTVKLLGKVLEKVSPESAGKVLNVPEFKGTKDAVEFGVANKDNAIAIDQLKIKYKEANDLTKALVDQGRDDEAFVNSQKAQLYREAIGGAEGRIKKSQAISLADLNKKLSNKFSDDEKQAFAEASDMLFASEGPQIIVNDDGDYSRLSSGWPTFLSNRGYSAKELQNIFAKISNDKPLTDKQLEIAKSILKDYNDLKGNLNKAEKEIDPELLGLRARFPEITDEEIRQLEAEIEKEDIWDESKYQRAVEKYIAKKEGNKDAQGEISSKEVDPPQGVSEPQSHYETFSPPFYSKLQKTIQEKMPNAATTDMIRGILSEKNGVKAEEYKWLGIDDFLSGKTKITKQELLDHIRENQVQVQEVEKGGAKKHTIESIGWKQDSPGTWHAEVEGRRFGMNQESDGIYVYEDGGVLGQVVNSFADAKEKVIGALKNNPSTKFQSYQLPGGENYREMLLTLPSKKSDPEIESTILDLQKEYGISRRQAVDGINNGNYQVALTSAQRKNLEPASHQNFTSPHFDEPNILAHVRMNDRVDSEGKKVLFLEEVQSDWHQKGKKEGYQQKIDDKELAELRKQLQENIAAAKPYTDKGMDAPQEMIDRHVKLNERIDALDRKKNDGVPNAPFKKSWHELALKRMLRYAAENGYDKLAWTTGEQQNARYDLSKQVDNVVVRKRADGTYNVGVTEKGKSGLTIIKEVTQESELPDLIGKDLADKVVNQEPTKLVKYEGSDLVIGGQGMRGFYDQIIPSFVNKYTKKWGGRVGETSIKEEGTTNIPGASGMPYTKSVKVHSLELTPSMKSDILNVGQQLFEPQGEYYGKDLFDTTGKANLPNAETVRMLRKAPLSVKFQKDGFLVFPNQKIVSPADVASAFRGLTNSGIEHFYTVAVKNGEVQGVELITMGDLRSAAPSIYEFFGLLDHTKADGIYTIHNHPYGKLETSPEDRQFYRDAKIAIEATGVKVKGHIIIDTDKFVSVDADGKEQVITHKEFSDTKKVDVLKKYFEWSVSKDDLGPQVKSERDIYEILKGSQIDQKNATLIALSNQNQIMNTFLIPREKLDAGSIIRYLTNARAGAVILVNSGKTGQELNNYKEILKQAKIALLDSIDPKNGTFVSWGSGQISENTPKYESNRISEEKKKELSSAFGKFSLPEGISLEKGGDSNGKSQKGQNGQEKVLIPAGADASAPVSSDESGKTIVPLPSEDKLENIYQRVFNRFQSIENVVDRARALGAEIKPGEDAGISADRYLSIANQAESVLRNGTYKITPEGTVKMTGEGLKPILEDFDKAFPKKEQFLKDYLIARRTIEDLQRPKDDYSGESIVTKQQVDEAKRKIALIEKELGDTKSIEKTAQRIYDYQKRVLENLVDSGILSEEKFLNILDKNPNYIPFDRIMPDEDNASGTPVAKKPFSAIRNPIKKIKGSELSVHDPIESIIKNTYRIMDASSRNKVFKDIYALKDIEGLGFKDVPVPLVPVATVTHKAAIDHQFMRELSEFAVSLGASPIETTGQISRAMGYYYHAGKRITRKFGTPRELQAHETAHFFDHKFGLKERFYKRGATKPVAEEMIAHMKRMGESANRIKKTEERFADAFEWWLTNRDLAKETLPLFSKEMEKIIEDIPQLKPILNIKPNPGFSVESMKEKVFIPSQFAPKGNIVEGSINGQKKYLEVTENIKQAMTGMNEVSSSILMKILATPSGWLRVGATITPEFVLRNPIRDQWTALLQTQVGYRPFLDSGAAISDILGKSDVYKDWIRSGGSYAGFVELSRPALAKMVKQLKDQPDLLKGLNIISHMQDISQLMEQATRVGVYKAAIRRGMTAVEAALESRESTINFSRRGTDTKEINSAIAFFNAGLQGLDKSFRSAKKDPVGFTTKAIATITIPSLLLYLKNRNDDDYAELPRWQKDLFWMTKVGDTWWRIPKPFLYGQLFGSVPERFLEYLDTQDPDAFNKLSDSIYNSLSPIAGDPLSGLMPTLAKPLIENQTNWSFFRQSRIVSSANENLIPSEQYGKYDSETSKLIGKIFNVSPSKVENLSQGWFGGSGKYVMQSGDLAIKSIMKLQGAEMPGEAPTEYSDIPLVKGFAARSPTGYNSESVKNFYEVKKEINALYNTFKKYEKIDEDKADKFLEDHPEIDTSKDLDRAAKRITDLSKDIEDVISSDASSDEKRYSISEIEKEMTDIAKESYQSVKERRKEAQRAPAGK